MNAPRLEFQAIEKRFFGVSVLKSVSFSVRIGTTLGLVGENGAGKSTLMNILGGVHQPDGGRMLIDGKPFAPHHPQDSARAGVAFIHQELNLFSNLSIAENMFITSFPRIPRSPFIDRGTIKKRTQAFLRQVGLHAMPDTRIETLSAGERQLVEIAKALSIDARIIIFDEPATSLTTREIERLFGLISELRARGITMIYISHNLTEVMALCSDIVVLRDGEVAGMSPTRETGIGSLVSLMVGRDIEQLYPQREAKPSRENALEVRGLSQPGIVRNITFNLRGQEVLGISGLMGSGRSELARILFGLDPFEFGEIRVFGEGLPAPSPETCIRKGMAFLTENRREEGLCMEASISENMALVALPSFATRRLSWINRLKVSEALATLRGAVLMISSEIEELIGLCDRILVMCNGEITDEIHRAEFDRERILHSALKKGPSPAEHSDENR